MQPPTLTTSPEVRPLTRRQRQVAALIAEGYTSPAIARFLGTTPKTIRNHRTDIAIRLDLAPGRPSRHLAALVKAGRLDLTTGQLLPVPMTAGD